MNLFNFCPKCGGAYFSKRNNKAVSFLCKNCSFILYNNPKPVVNGMIFNEKNEILMVERNKKPYKKYWGMPGGFVNYAEDPIKALGRELKEELGVKFNIGKIVGTYNEIYLNNGDKNERYSTIVIVYEIKFKEKDKKNVLFSNEVSKFDFFSKDNLPKKIAFKNQRFFLFENIAKNK